MFSPYDSFDTSLSDHFRVPSPDPVSDPYSDLLDDPYYLDQSICSNFSCCGQTLPDLHRLLEHFEDVHVLPLPSDNRPLYSSPVYAHPRPSPPRASYIISYPQPDPPLHPLPHNISRPLADLPIPFPPVPDLVHSPLSTASSTTTSCYSSPTLAQPLCLPPALFTVQRPRTPPTRRRRDSDGLEHTSIDRSCTHPLSGPQRTGKHQARVDPVAKNRPLASTPERAPLLPVRRQKEGREKAFKCPHPGCTKQYLNPNGLKYHLEKGTCTNAEACPRAQLPPEALAALPSAALPSSVALSASVGALASGAGVQDVSDGRS